MNSKATRDAYWAEHAKPIILERDLFIWTCREYKARGGVRPTTAEISTKKQQLEVEYDPACALPPRSCWTRQTAMHQAIVVKATSLLAEIVENGKVGAAAERANAPSSNFFVEDIFNYQRRLHERCPITRVGVMEAMRRVKKAPHLGGTEETRCAFTISSPPAWYTPWLKRSLRQRARYTIRKEWPSRAERATTRWMRTKELSQIARAKRQRLEQASEEQEEVIRSMAGGMVGTGEEREQVPPLELIDLERFSRIDFDTDRASWPIKTIKNQLRLRNLQAFKDKRPTELTRLLCDEESIETEGSSRRTLLTKAGGDFYLAGTRATLIKRLERIVQVEEHARQLHQDMEQLQTTDSVRDAARRRNSRTRRLPSHLSATGSYAM